jgi:hypothetical protein
VRAWSWRSTGIVGATLLAEVGYGVGALRVLGQVIGPICMVVIAISTIGWPTLFPLAAAGRLALIGGWLTGAGFAGLTFAVVGELRPQYPLTAAALLGVVTASVSVGAYGAMVRRDQGREAARLDRERREWLARLPKVGPEQ